MGCGPSSQRGDPDPPPRQLNIGPPTDLMLHVPRPRPDEHGNARRISDHELDRQTLEGALDSMAQYIRSRGQNITVISTGGAVNTILLQTRQSTHDVDFFGTISRTSSASWSMKLRTMRIPLAAYRLDANGSTTRLSFG